VVCTKNVDQSKLMMANQKVAGSNPIGRASYNTLNILLLHVTWRSSGREVQLVTGNNLDALESRNVGRFAEIRARAFNDIDGGVFA